MTTRILVRHRTWVDLSRDGQYFILVTAYDQSQTGSFQIRVTRAEGSFDPCTTGAVMDMPAAVISFMPDGTYQMMTCANGM